MGRDIQPQANRARGVGVKAFLGLLATAIFWLVVAIAFPARIVPQLIPELAESVQWLPIVFYGLAFWHFIRAVRSLRGLGTPRRSVAPVRTESAKAEGAKKAGAGSAMPPATRQPTVQRMR